MLRRHGSTAICRPPRSRPWCLAPVFGSPPWRNGTAAWVMTGRWSNSFRGRRDGTTNSSPGWTREDSVRLCSPVWARGFAQGVRVLEDVWLRRELQADDRRALSLIAALARGEPVPPIYSIYGRNPSILDAPATGSLVAPKDAQLMTRHDDIKLSYGVAAKGPGERREAGSCAGHQCYQITLKGPDFCAGRNL